MLPLISSHDEVEKVNQRWFTISSAPVEGTIHITTRVSRGAFKQALNALKPGDQIKTHSLAGSFIWEDVDSAPWLRRNQLLNFENKFIECFVF